MYEPSSAGGVCLRMPSATAPSVAQPPFAGAAAGWGGGGGATGRGTGELLLGCGGEPGPPEPIWKPPVEAPPPLPTHAPYCSMPMQLSRPVGSLAVETAPDT